MNKKILVLRTLLTVLVCIVAFTFTAYATGEVTPTTPVAVETTPEVPPVETPTTAPDNSYDDSGSTSEIPDDSSSDDGYYDDSYIEEETVAPNAGYVENSTSNSYVDSYTDENGYYYYDEEEMVNNIEDTAGSVSDYTNLYDTSDVNEAELEEAEWVNITLNTSKGDALDFSSIKDNTESDDNGQWIIYTGFILIGLSLLGILYFIIATATYKKKLKKLKAREQRQRHRDNNRPRDDYGDLSDYPTQQDYNKRYQRNRYAASGMSYSERKRQKADTAEINIPRRYEARH